MLTRLVVRNFKRLSDIEIELGSPVVFIGPNNSGKTSAMPALALWEVGLRRWYERHADKPAPEKRPGVTVGRRDLVAVPVPHARLLWHSLAVRESTGAGYRRGTANIRIEVVVEGVAENGEWKCGLEFDYANEESFYCRPLRLGDGQAPERMAVPAEKPPPTPLGLLSPPPPIPVSERMAVPAEAAAVRIAFLPPMSGIAVTETRLEPGAVNVRVGEGRTAEVLRNLCYRIHQEQPEDWETLTERIKDLFDADLCEPRHIVGRGEIEMSYREGGSEFDISSSGRGLQQTMLLLSYMYANKGTVLLLDEPDAHLETLRQRETYKLITDVASDSGSQIIAASHSEIVLNEAADKDAVVSFLPAGRPRSLGDHARQQVLKALKEIRFDQYIQAEQTGWVLYLEGSTDLSILQAFARRLGHEDSFLCLKRPFVHYVGNDSSAAKRHFYGLREAIPTLRGVALFDRMDIYASQTDPLVHMTWRRREIENYICSESSLTAYATASSPWAGSLDEYDRQQKMISAINEIICAMHTLGKGSPWSIDTKVSDDFLKPLFDSYFKRLGHPNSMTKSNFHELVEHMPVDEIDPEVSEKLDAIARVASIEDEGHS